MIIIICHYDRHNELEFNGLLTDSEAQIPSQLTDFEPQLLAKSVIKKKPVCDINLMKKN